MGRQKRKRYKWIFLIVYLLTCSLLRIEGAAAVSNGTTVDFVLVLDCSGSMASSDTEKLTVSAAKMFVDMLPTENARLAVVLFGSGYGTEAYEMNINADDSSNASLHRVKLAWELQSITGQKAKSMAKAVINQELERAYGDHGYTPIGFALEAACQILEEGEAKENSAGIILMSDGRLGGQGEQDSYREGLCSHSVDRAVETASSKNWPIYCLELNYDKQNDVSNEYRCKRARYEMREHIPAGTGTEPIKLSSATDAQDRFAEIFAKFFNADPTTASGTIEDGSVSLDFDIDEMIAETNLTLTGDIAQVREISIRSSDGEEKRYSDSLEEENRIVTYDDKGKYITVKLLIPQKGTWNVTAYGTDGVEIGLYVVSIREMDLQLHASREGNTGEMLTKGTTIDFHASFIYNGTVYASDTVYRNTEAYLVIEETGEQIRMEADNQGFSASYTMAEAGTYTVKAYVESELFRNERKESGSYTYQVGNNSIEATGSIEPQVLRAGESASDIDCAQYFTNVDSYTVRFSADWDRTSGIQADISDRGILSVRAGNTAGSFDIKILANDGMQSNAAEQIFHIEVENQPLCLTENRENGMTVQHSFCYNAGPLPYLLLDLLNISKESAVDIKWKDYFEDPDGVQPQITVMTLENDGGLQAEEMTGMLRVSGISEGRAVYQVTATDANDPTVSCMLQMEINCRDVRALLWDYIKLPFFIVASVLIVIVILLIIKHIVQNHW